ncbi:hypothetical protein Sru01_22730 [Sphaerisporangium rufum]|uniref:histidine kinase n=1 Tax=Sphaerisporangium rufum TaxID=1381558 RepID=A0A919UXS0_9ACTN|nr:histidine kinase [Sphaerisporangium rufum]GII77291.1 hypothetical protein Sru01_22730 [Sphaerisporangium rufum]
MISRMAALPYWVARPWIEAAVTGNAGPPPARSRWLRPRTPRLPFRTVHLVAVADVIIAWVMFATGLAFLMSKADAISPPTQEPALWALAAGFSIPLALRERWPLAAWRLATLAAAAGSLGYPQLLQIPTQDAMPYIAPQVITFLLCSYTAATRAGRRTTIGIWLITTVGAWIAHPNSMVLVSLLVAGVLLFGYNVRVRRAATARMHEERRGAAEQRAARAVLEERTRIARELHDVVAHHMSVIAIQAEAVPLRAAGDPDALAAGLAEIRGLSLAALAEMRQVLGALRGEDGRRETAPQPGLDRLDELVANARSAGLEVTVTARGRLDPPTAVGLSAYRILQESLSNAMRHAPGCAVTVEVTGTATLIRLRVRNGPPGRPDTLGVAASAPGDRGAAGHGAGPAAGPVPGDGPAAAAPSRAGRRLRAVSAGRAATAPPAGGRGIIGMRERAALLGGTLTAGPTLDGGFMVTAELPFDDVQDLKEARKTR